MSFRAEAMRHGLRTVCSGHLLCTVHSPGHLLIWQRHHLAVLHLRATSAIPCSATSSPAHLLCCSRRAQLACTHCGPPGHCAVSMPSAQHCILQECVLAVLHMRLLWITTGPCNRVHRANNPLHWLGILCVMGHQRSKRGAPAFALVLDILCCNAWHLRADAFGCLVSSAAPRLRSCLCRTNGAISLSQQRYRVCYMAPVQ